MREVITKLNQDGEKSLRERREILKRIVEFQDFSVCWPEDSYKAKGMVSDIRNIVNVKDSFTRIKQELDLEKLKHQTEHLQNVENLRKKEQEQQSIKLELFSLFSIPDNQSQKRGKLLEGILNRLFKSSGILVKEAFELVDTKAGGIIEQIDGVIEIDGYIFLVEMKWWKEPLGKQDISPHLVNVFNRGHAGGIMISSSGYTEPAIATCKEALTQKTIILCELEEIVRLLEKQFDLLEFFKLKIQNAVIQKNPLTYPLR